MASTKRAVLMLALMLSTLSISQATGSEQTAAELFSWSYPEPTLTSTTNQFVAGLVTNKLAATARPIPAIVLTNGVRRLGPSFTNSLAQGIYMAVPYSMIVASPGPFPDNNIIGPIHGPDRMPVIRPELKLVPTK